MPQTSGRPMIIRPPIDATVPGTMGSPVKNISDAAKKKQLDEWDRLAAERKAQVERETAAPTIPSRIIRFELQQFGQYWQACVIEPGVKVKGIQNAKVIPLLGTPSLLGSALDALEDAILQRANRA